MSIAFLHNLTDLPLMARFAVAMAVILVVPALCQRVRLPAVVGLLPAGIAFGPHGLQVGPKSNEVAHFFSDVGKLLLMFFAGLEIDLAQFRRTGHRSLACGLATFALPLAAGAVAGLAFGYGWLAAILIGSLLASHTLLGYVSPGADPHRAIGQEAQGGHRDRPFGSERVGRRVGVTAGLLTVSIWADTRRSRR